MDGKIWLERQAENSHARHLDGELLKSFKQEKGKTGHYLEEQSR